jgi:hypothetical protein
MLKGEPVFQRLFDEERLADTSSAIYGNELGAIAVEEML